MLINIKIIQENNFRIIINENKQTSSKKVNIKSNKYKCIIIKYI